MIKEKKDFFESIFISSKRKPNLIETDREIFNNIFQAFLNRTNMKFFQDILL